MKNIKVLMLMAVICFSGFALANAATTQNITVSAAVPNNSPELTLMIKELTTANQNPWTGTDVTTMSFGTLTHTLSTGAEAGVWYSSKYYCVIIFTLSFGHRYQITSTSLGLTSGANSLPSGSFGLTPGYTQEDEWSPGNAQGAMPTGSTLGTVGPAIATGKVIYTSEAAASNRIIRAFYSLPPYASGGGAPFTGYDPIPLTQASGTYSGTVTITIASY